MTRFAVVIAFEGPLETALSLRDQIEIFTLGGVPHHGVQHVTLHQNMLAEDQPPHQPWGAISLVPVEDQP